ncbi:MAG TPA: DUF4381 domain-containing protein [Gammaproteobacteria bacterium]|nr:DUF4381 domain-containing protein [Gammaproteobacteria bacterium]
MTPQLADQLRDIHGLDAIPWWPLAPGWWLLAALGVLLILALVLLLRNLRRYPAGSWRRDAWRQLRTLRQRGRSLPVNQLAGELSQLLRRIAVARLGRERAAGLSGERWLQWLQDNDPAGFQWTTRGKVLLSLPYAPPDQARDGREQLLVLIDAALVWTERRGGRRRV